MNTIKLKTVKDLEKELVDWYDKSTAKYIIYELTKYAADCYRNYDSSKEEHDYYTDSILNRKLLAKMEFIRWFFNLKEKDII